MKISHIQAKAIDELCLTHFLHFKYTVINILEIVSLNFHAHGTVGIFTTDGVHHLISDEQDIKELKAFFQRS